MVIAITSDSRSERPRMFCTHARRAWSCPTSGIAKTLHELFFIQHHRLFWHIGPDPFWQTAPWLARALQLIRQSSMGLLCPRCYLCTPKLVVLRTIPHPTHTAKPCMCGVEHLPSASFCKNLQRPIHSTGPFGTSQNLPTVVVSGSCYPSADRKAACGGNKKSFHARINFTSFPPTRCFQCLSDCNSDCTYVWPFQHVGDGSHHSGSVVEDGHQINLIQTLKPHDNVLILHHPKIREIWGDIDRNFF